MARNDAFRERVYRQYMEFFELAERNRRWSLFDDIPWDQLDPSKSDEEAVLNAETFCGVEMYLPDYVAGGMNVVRDMFGQAWFQANWAYEEQKHALALREFLVRSGHRSQAQMFAYEKRILSLQWDRPFHTARQMTFYGAIQEGATHMMYRHQQQRAHQRGDVVLSRIYQLIGRDEAAHSDFYRKVVALEIEEDRDDVLMDLAFVFKHFEMPAAKLVPDYEARVEVMRSHGGVDRSNFLKEVWFPTLRKLGVTRQELVKAATRASRLRAVEPPEEQALAG